MIIFGIVHGKILKAVTIYAVRVALPSTNIGQCNALTGQATELVNLELDLFWRGHDHAGPSILIELFGYMFHAKIYDSRHWNYDKACWYLPGEQDTKD